MSFKQSPPRPTRKVPIYWILGACLSAITIQASYASIRPGFKGLVYNRFNAQLDESILLHEGPHFLIPYVQKPIKIAVKTQRMGVQVFLTSERDKYIKYSIKYEPMEGEGSVKEIYKTLGKDYNIAMELYAKAVVRNALADRSLIISLDPSANNDQLPNQLESLIKSKFKEYHFNAHDITVEELKL